MNRYGLLYYKQFFNRTQYAEMMDYLLSLHPIFEKRFRQEVLDAGLNEEQRELLRPVYWLGNWQFACLDYYHPPHGIKNRCVRAESFPPFMQTMINKVEAMIRVRIQTVDIPKGWKLNTCLVNYYGDKIVDDKKIDCARVGDHRDFEPGPVASLSFGERAYFQFVRPIGKDKKSQVVHSMWLDDNSLQIFASAQWKDKLFHRVQRVEKKLKNIYPIPVENFETRRINLTFRYVPEEDWVNYRNLPMNLKSAVEPYVLDLGRYSPFFKAIIES